MTIYIQSRGIAPEEDYRWVKITDNQQIVSTPGFLNQLSLVSLIDSQKFSLVLTRQPEHFILLITGLEGTKARVDFMGRKIRNSVVWVLPLSEEDKIRTITIAALEGKLADLVEEAIVRDSNSECGFIVNLETLETIGNLIDLQHYNNLDLNGKLGNNCENLKQEIALEIKENNLPKSYDFLIVITTIKSAIDLEKLKVWRGLSSRIESKQFTAINSEEKKTLPATVLIVTATIIALTVFLIL